MSEFTKPTPPHIKGSTPPPPVPAFTPGPAPKPAGMSKTTAVILTAVVTGVLTSLCWVLVYFTIKDLGDLGEMFSSEPPPFYISAEAPELMEVGDTCVIDVRVSNESDKKHTLSYIDIMDSLLDGFEVVSIHPKPRSKSNSFGVYSYHSKHHLEPGEEANFKFTLKAKELGEWSSTIDACDPMHEYVSDTVEIEVLEKGGIARMKADEEEDGGQEDGEAEEPEEAYEEFTE